jgi:MFS family permease
LTNCGWTETAIGLVLSLGTIAAMASQIPAGALVDAIRHKVYVVLLSIASFSVSALMFALRPAPLSVYIAEILHSLSSCTPSPAQALGRTLPTFGLTSLKRPDILCNCSHVMY